MSFDFDGFSDFKPGSGQVVVSDGNYQSVTAIATTAAISNATATWKVEESVDGGTTWTDNSASAVYRVAPSGTSTAFHASTNSKAPQVRFTLMNNGTAATATYTYLLGHAASAPFLGVQMSGPEDGYTVAPTS